MEEKLSIQHCKNLGILKTGEKRGVRKLLAGTVCRNFRLNWDGKAEKGTLT